MGLKLAENAAAIETLIPDVTVLDGKTETPFPHDTAGWTALVERGIYIDDTDEERPDEPWNADVDFRAPGLVVLLRMRAGSGLPGFRASGLPGRRMAANSLSIRVYPRGSDLVSAHLIEDLVISAAEIWHPACATAWDLAGARAASERQRWAPTPGQRAWVPRDLGVVSTTAAGVTAQLTPSGTLLITDDTLTATEAIAAVQETFLANGMTEIQHGLPA